MSNMYEVVKNVIASKNYDLKDILGKIESVWVQSRITDEQKAELIDLARQNAEVQQSIDVMLKLEELDKRVKANEEAIKKLTETEEAPEEGGETVEPTFPEYEVGKWYYSGDIVMFEGKAYKCIAPGGVVCTWSPAEYPAYWEVYVEDAPLTEDTEADALLTE